MKEYRICENPVCRYKNDLSYMECTECGMTLEGVIITTEYDNETPQSQQNQTEPLDQAVPGSGRETKILRKIKLVSTKDGFEIFIPALGCLIGREGDVSPEYFSAGKHDYISNQHARIILKEDSYIVVDESRNGTTLNNRLLIKGREYKLEIGDKIVFADMEFNIGEW